VEYEVKDRVRTLDSPDPGVVTATRRHTGGERQRMTLINWESWLIRLVLAALALFDILAGSRNAGVAPAVAFVISFIPPVISHFSRLRVPRVLELAWVLSVALIGAADALFLYDRIIHFGKFVHGVEGFLIASMSGYLLLAYRDREELSVHTHVVAMVSGFVGVTFGAFWEFLEYVLDWIRYSDLQKSNTDTMTDMLWNNLGAVLGTMLILRLYYHRSDLVVRRELGDLAAWALSPIGHLLDRRGKLLAVLALVGIALYVAALWFAERPLPFVAPQ
jgi:hypothetical protein